MAEQWKTLENDEQTLEQFKDDLEKMEHERNQINQDKIACRDKLEKGTKLFEEMAGESSSWKRELAAINDEIDNLLGNVLVYAASICLLPAFHFDKRYVLGFPLSRDFSNFQVPGLSGSLGPVLPGPRDLQSL